MVKLCKLMQELLVMWCFVTYLSQPALSISALNRAARWGLSVSLSSPVIVSSCVTLAVWAHLSLAAHSRPPVSVVPVTK